MSGKFTSILMALILLGSTGCTGSRLRNLISRSDYQNLEDIEAADQAAETETASDTQLVSESREANDEATVVEAEDEEDERPGLLNIAGLFRRDRQQISPDPFVEEDSSGAKGTDNRVAAIPKESAEQIVRKAAAEGTQSNPAEKLIRDAVAGADEAAAEADDFAEIANAEPVITPETSTESAGSTVQKSFADFIAEQQQKNTERPTEIVEAAAQSVANSDNPFEQTVEEAPDAVTEFNELLTGQVDSLAGQVDAADASEVFPGIDELLAETEQVNEEEPSLDQFFSDASEADEQSDTGNPFAEVTTEEAAEQHGFKATPPAADNDPWAAFQQLQAAAGIDREATDDDADAFAWATEPAAGDNKDTTTTESAPVVTVAAPVEAADSASTFRNVSAAYEVQPAAPEFETPAAAEPADLVIPTTQAPAAEGNLFTTPFDATEADPFADAEDADAEITRTETAAGAPFIGLSGRTWFLLLGLGIVAVLLFLPERQNRTDS